MHGGGASPEGRPHLAVARAWSTSCSSAAPPLLLAFSCASLPTVSSVCASSVAATSGAGPRQH